MENNRKTLGHLAAGLSILVWGVTYVSTKILLEDFSPMEILFFRFIIAYIMLFLLSPHPIVPKLNRKELLYAAAGLCGITVYFLFQNIGLTYTLASNAGVLTSVAPMFTAIIAHFILPDEGLHKRFVVGFLLAISGVSLISFNGSFVLELNPLGDLLFILAALAWAFYCNILTIIDAQDLSLIQRTRKVFFYGILFMLPALILTDFNWDLIRFKDPLNLLNTLFLGLGASGVCFLTWNYAVGILGSVKTSVYIYLMPIVTIIFSALILHEPITWISLTGTALILIGLVISEKKQERQGDV